MWNKAAFLKNIDYLIENECGGIQQKFNERIHDRQAVTKWKSEKKDSRPSIDVLLRIAEEFGVSIDWLLGIGECKNKACPVMCDEAMMRICADIKKIRDSKSHWWGSLSANIDSFKIGLENDIEVKKIPDLERKIKVLEALTSPGRKSGTRKGPARRTGEKRKVGSSM